MQQTPTETANDLNKQR